MSMSKKDYETIADVLTTCSNDRDDTLLQLAWRFSQENDRFQWDTFLEAADYTGDYKIDRYGVIRSPGKFENEAVYMPIAYEMYLQGDGIELDERLISVSIRWAGNEAYEIVFYEDNEGFLWEQVPEASDD